MRTILTYLAISLVLGTSTQAEDVYLVNVSGTIEKGLAAFIDRVVEEAESQTLFRNPQHPYTKALLGSVLTPDPSLDVPDTHLGATFPNPVEPPSGCTFHPRCVDVMPVCSQTAPAPTMANDACVECHLYREPERAAS